METEAVNLVNLVHGSENCLASHDVIIEEICVLMGLLLVKGLSFVPTELLTIWQGLLSLIQSDPEEMHS